MGNHSASWSSPPQKRSQACGKEEKKKSAIYKSRADQVEGGRVVGQAKTQSRTSRTASVSISNKQTKRLKIIAHPTIMRLQRRGGVWGGVAKKNKSNG
jgi:hypothetical protein